MNEESYKREIEILQYERRQIEDEFYKAQKLLKELEALQYKLDSLPSKAQDYLKTELTNCRDWEEVHIRIQRVYTEWLDIQVSFIQAQIFKVLNDLFEGNGIYPIRNNIVDSFHLFSNTFMHKMYAHTMYANQSVDIDDVIRTVYKQTKEAFEEIHSLLSEKVDEATEFVHTKDQELRKLEHDISWLDYHYTKFMQSSDVVARRDKHTNNTVSYSSVDINNIRSNKDLANTPNIDIPNNEATNTAVGGYLLRGMIGSFFGIGGVLTAAYGAIGAVGIGTMKKLGFKSPKEKKNPKNENSIDSSNHEEPNIENKTESSKVNSAIYAPSEVNRNESVIIQVYVYKPCEEHKVAKIASEVDTNATRRNYVPLSSIVKKGDNIKIMLRCYSKSIEIEKSSYEGIWNDEMFKHEFVAYVPEDFNKSNFLCAVNLFINDIPVGDMKFKINVVDYKPRKLWTEIKNNGYKKSFISYSHADVERIRFLAEGFKIQGIDYFFDEHSLRTGDNYPKEIDDYISSCDVFVLCWSENAKSSEWVRRECDMALQRYDSETDDLKIYPLSVAPKADLPSKLQEKFHFGIIE